MFLATTRGYTGLPIRGSPRRCADHHVFDQHVSSGSSAPLPDGRHTARSTAARQRQCMARGKPPFRRAFGEEIEKLCRFRRASRTRRFDNAWSSSCRGLRARPRPMTLSPEAWAATRSWTRTARFTNTTPPSWSLGTARRDRLLDAVRSRHPDRTAPPGPLLVTTRSRVMGSEVGVLPCRGRSSQWRLQRKMRHVWRTADHLDDELKRRLSTANPYRQWLARTQTVEYLPAVGSRAARPNASLLDRQQASLHAGDLSSSWRPGRDGQEAVGSMYGPAGAVRRASRSFSTATSSDLARYEPRSVRSARDRHELGSSSFRGDLFDLRGAVGAQALECASRFLTNAGSRKDPRHGDIAANVSRPRRSTSPTGGARP